MKNNAKVIVSFIDFFSNENWFVFKPRIWCCLKFLNYEINKIFIAEKTRDDLSLLINNEVFYSSNFFLYYYFLYSRVFVWWKRKDIKKKLIINLVFIILISIIFLVFYLNNSSQKENEKPYEKLFDLSRHEVSFSRNSFEIRAKNKQQLDY